MALTIRHLNTDASFLLTFEPIVPASVSARGPPARPFHILLDPWITGPSKIFHPKVSLTRHKEPACVASLDELPTPDVVIVSQAKTDHCNEATLRQIPPGARTLILAEPGAARIIKRWKHFDRRRVWALKRWADSGSGGGAGPGARVDAVVRIPLPPVVRGGEPGEVTVTYIPQRRDLTRLHAAVGITFRPPPVTSSSRPIPKLGSTTAVSNVPFMTTPPATLKSHKSHADLSMSTKYMGPSHAYPHQKLRSRATKGTPAKDPAFPAPSPASLRSVRSASTLMPTITSHSNITLTPTLSSNSTLASNPLHTHVSNSQRTLSLLFSPHGMPFAGPLSSYATTHLVKEAALPLTALLHCFDSVKNPWWLGGRVLLGAPAGREIAMKLGAKVWVSCHDGEKDVRGLATGWVRTRKWDRSLVQKELRAEAGEEFNSRTMAKRGTRARSVRPVTSAGRGTLNTSTTMSSGCSAAEGEGSGQETQVLSLDSGEKIILTSKGVWNPDHVMLSRRSVQDGADLDERRADVHALDKVLLQSLEKSAPDAERFRGFI